VADRKITDLTALTTPASADVLPIVDVSEAAAADKNKKITVGELFKGVPDGTAAAPAIAFESDDGNGIFLSTTDTVGIATNGSSRMTVSTTAVTSTLPVIVPDGTAAAPSVAFTGSGTDTGIYSPGIDQVAVATNGVQRLYIDSTGSIGVGTTTKAWESGQFFAVQFGKGGAVFGRAAGDEDRNGFVSNAYHDAASWKYIASSAHATRYEQSDGNHLWYYAGTGTADASVAFSEAMRITSAGLVGIGNSSPSGLLDLAGTKNLSSDIGQIIVRDSASYATGVGGAVVLAGKYNSGGSYTAGAYLNARKENSTDGNYSFALGFGTIANGGAISENMTLDSSGRLGIGTTAPQNRLQVGDYSGANYITVGSSSSTKGGILFADGITGNEAYRGYVEYEPLK
jgi:hypothetical protein